MFPQKKKEGKGTEIIFKLGESYMEIHEFNSNAISSFVITPPIKISLDLFF